MNSTAELRRRPTQGYIVGASTAHIRRRAASSTPGGGAAGFAKSLAVSFRAGIRRCCLSHPGYGGQRAPYEGCSQQPKRLTARDVAAGKASSQLVEVAPTSFFGHHCSPPSLSRSGDYAHSSSTRLPPSLSPALRTTRPASLRTSTR